MLLNGLAASDILRSKLIITTASDKPLPSFTLLAALHAIANIKPDLLL